MAKYNVSTEYQDLELERVVEIYRENAKPFAVACLNLLGEVNIGMMVRTAFIFSAEKFYIIGRRSYDKRTAVGTNHYIPIERIGACEGGQSEFLNIPEIIRILTELQNEYTLVFIEQHERAVELQEIKWERICNSRKPLFIFGNEGGGISVEILDAFRESPIVMIPRTGIGRSLNVSIACGIVLNTFFTDMFL